MSLRAMVVAIGLAAGAVSPAAAADASAEAQAADAVDASDTGVGEIVVTARRVAENLQDVPQQVTALTADNLSKLAITQIDDIAQIVPALSLAADGYGFASPQIRGLPRDAIASQNPTVDAYLNEAPIDGDNLYAGLFDIGNIQVLEGPQGTSRGRTAPSGAILLTTRRPDVDRFGGYVSGQVAEYGEYNAQGAVNVPVIPGKLAIRVAGLYNQANGFVRSANSTIKPGRRDLGARITALFTPSDDFDVLVTYQHFDQRNTSFLQVMGTGSPGLYNAGTQAAPNLVDNPNPSANPGYNGPVIAPFDRLGVADVPSISASKYDFVSGQINANVLGHRLTYIGSYTNSRSSSSSASDAGNQYRGAVLQAGPTPSYSISQEFRISSEPGGFFDYTLGYFYSKTDQDPYLQRSDGAPYAAWGAAPYDPDAGINTSHPLFFRRYVKAPIKRSEHSIFASVTLHPGPNTEITLGGRKLFLSNDARVRVGIELSGPFNGGPLIIPEFVSPVVKSSPFVYSASISHRFTDDIMLYGNVGSSYRVPFPSVSVFNTANDPVLAELMNTKPEKSTSFELGLKTTWLDNRLRVNLTGFYQKFDGLLFTTLTVPYIGGLGGPSLSYAQFNVNGDAIVKGFNFDAAFQPSRNFSISAGLAYSKARLNNALVPCWDQNFDGTPDNIPATAANFLTEGGAVAQCRLNETISRTPLWKGTIQSEFMQPLNSSMDAYVRGLMTYYSSNANNSNNFVVPSYVMMTFYAGIRSANGAWDLGVFLRNATNTKVQLSQGATDLNAENTNPFGPAGYTSTSVTAPRQFGVSLRYSFGGR